MSEISRQFAVNSGDVLSVSHSKFLCNVLNIKPQTISEVNYPNGNILSLELPDNSFDFVLTDQVLEHVARDPQQAINESWRVLRPGGIAVHTTCFINPIHNEPGDYWRFTPAGGLRSLFTIDICILGEFLRPGQEFVVIMDDYNRPGEQDTAKALQEILQKKGIKTYSGIYEGNKSQILIAAEKYRYLTSL